MDDLKEALDVLYELKELRDRAKELRGQGRLSLKEILDTGINQRHCVELDKSGSKELRERWISSGNSVEVALLVKVQNHRDMGDEEDDENDLPEASPKLKKKLKELKLENLFPPTGHAQDIYVDGGSSARGRTQPKGKAQGDNRSDSDVSVLVAARAMQALVMRSESIFSKATLLCYYRIVRELYIAAQPDWTIGAARAGLGGNTSAFITGECIRAIFAFENAMRRTTAFFKQTSRLHGRYELLKDMSGVLITDPPPGSKGAASRSKTGVESGPIGEWADRAIERMWFDWYISTNPRNVNMALHAGDESGNDLLFHPSTPVGMKTVGEYLDGLRDKLREAIRKAKSGISEAKEEINSFRNNRQGYFFEWKLDGNSPTPTRKKRDEKMDDEEYRKELREYDRAESAHKFALGLLEKAEVEAERAADIIGDPKLSLKEVLKRLEEHFDENSKRVHRVLEPAKRYIRTVLNREVASTAFGRFDAGELVFAAASFGAITGWKPSELLTRACALLIDALPESGRLPTTRPFHSTEQGHRMLPIGCEMTRSLAQLLQKTGYEIEPQLVRRMLNIFEEKLIPLDSRSQGGRSNQVAWNFEGSPYPNRPCVWVTSVSVLAVDRVFRMLNERINSIIFKYFEVIKPEKKSEKPGVALGLNDLVYPDLGLSQYFQRPEHSMAIRLEQMRAHVMRVTLPKMYRDARGRKERVFSAIFYGPPGTGKTTLAEALALTGGTPLIRLSTSDLVVRGPAEIEGRARTVFEALSMLTQVVIILDEFEVVVGVRGQSDKSKDGEVFEFLRTGMLPKLVKLHDAAIKQSFVYCLATNYLAKIDPAAKRTGRFDLLTPVYDPDPLSRAGTLLYRLWRVTQRLEKEKGFSREGDGLLGRFIEVVEMTSNTRASRLAEDYFRLPKWVIDHDLPLPRNYQYEIPFFWYILGDEDRGFSKKKDLLDEEKQKAREEQQKARERQAETGYNLSDEEKRETAWLESYEEQLKGEAELLKEEARQKDWSRPADKILACLIGPNTEATRT